MKLRKQTMHSLTEMQRKRFEKAKGNSLENVEEPAGSIAVTQQPTLNHTSQAHGARDTPALLSGLEWGKAESNPCPACLPEYRDYGMGWAIDPGAKKDTQPERGLKCSQYSWCKPVSEQNWWNDSFGPNLIEWPPKCHEVMMYPLAQHTELVPTVFSVTETLTGLSSRALPRFESWYHQNSYPRSK